MCNLQIWFRYFTYVIINDDMNFRQGVICFYSYIYLIIHIMKLKRFLK